MLVEPLDSLRSLGALDLKVARHEQACGSPWRVLMNVSLVEPLDSLRSLGALDLTVARHERACGSP